MKHNRKKKIIISIVISLVLILALGGGIWFFASGKTAKPVGVYPFYEVGMTEYWGDHKESYGSVSTDRIQTVFLTSSQTVTEVFVQAGDTVKKGDPLLAFDTTLSDLALEKKRLEVEKLKLQLNSANAELARINAMKPMVIPQEPETPEIPEENLGTPIGGAYRIISPETHDGSGDENPIICWIAETTDLNDTLMETLRQYAETLQEANYEPPVPEETSPTEASAEDPTDPVDLTVDRYYAVFKMTEHDMSLGMTTTWQGLEISRIPDTDRFQFRFFDASGIEDPSLEEGSNTEDGPSIDFGSGFTAAEIARMRAEQEKTIKDLQCSIKMADAEYKIMQTETGDGKVYAQIDGEVVSLLAPEEALSTMQPVVKVSGGGGFYVEGTVSEMDREMLTIGQEVTVMDYNTGMSYVGNVTSIGDYPAADDYYGGSNPNSSYYPFTVFVDGEADLQAGFFASIQYSTAGSNRGIYLENPFLRTENGRSYVFVRGEDGNLEKRFVVTGRSLWGSYTEILEGLTEDDFIAFPYGKAVKDGVPALEGSVVDLYNY